MSDMRARHAVNFAYSVSPEFGEAAIVKMCELCQEKLYRTAW